MGVRENARARPKVLSRETRAWFRVVARDRLSLAQVAKLKIRCFQVLPGLTGPMLWWQSMVGRVAIHAPWLLGAFVISRFLQSEQGQAAFFQPVDAPIVGLVVVALLTGVCAWMVLLSTKHHGSAPFTVPPLRLRRVWANRNFQQPPSQLILKRDMPSPRSAHGWTRPITGAVASFFVLWGLVSAGALKAAAVAIGSSALLVHALAAALGFTLAMLSSITLLWLVSLAWKTMPDRLRYWLLDLAAPLLAVLLFWIAMYWLRRDVELVSKMGSHAIVVSGVLLLVILVQSCLLVLLAHGTPRMGWIFVALLAGVVWWQDPSFERANPLLSLERQGAASRFTDITTFREPLDPTSGTPSPTAAASAGHRQSPMPQAMRCEAVLSAPRPKPPKMVRAQAHVDEPVLISAEGGGMRAAYWTALSLQELALAMPEGWLDRVTLASGVSGGSLGLATFLAAQELPREARLACIREFLAGDFLAPLAAGLLYLDVPRLVIPKSLLDEHRGDYFELFLARRWQRLTGSDYFYRPLPTAHQPSLVNAAVSFNATDALGGQSVTLASKAATVQAAHRREGSAHSGLSRTSQLVLRELHDMSIAQAVHTSARFVYISPNPDLRVPEDEASMALFARDHATPQASKRTVSAVSLVDGGYFDNGALWPALGYLADLKPDVLQSTTVIHIVNDQSRSCVGMDRNSGCEQAELLALRARRDAGSFGWLWRPLEAIEASRAAHSLQSVEAVRTIRPAAPMTQWQVPMPEALPFDTSLLEGWPDAAREAVLSVIGPLRIDRVPLAWTLSPSQREFLCLRAAGIRATGLSGTQDVSAVDRAQECKDASRP